MYSNDMYQEFYLQFARNMFLAFGRYPYSYEEEMYKEMFFEEVEVKDESPEK